MISASVYLRGGGSFNVLFARPLSPMNREFSGRLRDSASAGLLSSVIR